MIYRVSKTYQKIPSVEPKIPSTKKMLDIGKNLNIIYTCVFMEEWKMCCKKKRVSKMQVTRAYSSLIERREATNLPGIYSSIANEN